MKRLLAAIALALALAAPAQAAPAFPRLLVEPGADAAIADDAGREVLLRGFNVNQLNDYFAPDPALPTVVPLREDDFAQIAALGANSVRLGFNWSRWQPQRGTFDSAYLAQVRQAVRWAAAHGLYVILDLHQDSWGKDVASAPGEACPPGFGPAVGWDGAPSWANRFDGLSRCRAADTRELSPAVAQAFQSFFADRDGIQSELVVTWGRIAAALAAEPNVAGYDLFNEPHPGYPHGANGSVLLGRFYARAIDAIRAGEARAGAPARIAFFEPTVVWSGFGTDALPPPGFTDDDQIVFAPHIYAESLTLYGRAGAEPVTIERGFELAERAAAMYGAPVWSGEWAFFGDPRTDAPKTARYAAEEDERAVGGSYWVWRQACGDPHVAGYTTASGSFNPLACPSGAPQGRVAAYERILSRPVIRFGPGRLGAQRSDADTRAFRFRGADDDPAGSCRLEAWVPGNAEPLLTATGVTGLTVTPVPGGFIVAGCARNAYELSGRPEATLRAAPCTSKRRVTVTLPRRARSALVRIAGRPARRVRTRGGRRVTVDLRGLPAGRHRVTIRAGRSELRRAYRTCTPGRGPR